MSPIPTPTLPLKGREPRSCDCPGARPFFAKLLALLFRAQAGEGLKEASLASIVDLQMESIEPSCFAHPRFDPLASGDYFGDGFGRFFSPHFDQESAAIIERF